ncbi:hypothetical protein CBGD1_1845 [Sulfurimonas gotlandica GD1]|nr:hypothetical protein CBGD1_1845 [Sulfurimonas gotlandica GD1]
MNDILEQIKNFTERENINIDLIIVPELSPDGLVLNYSTNFKYKEREIDLDDVLHTDLSLSLNSNIYVLHKFKSRFGLDYGEVDINDVNYRKYVKKWHRNAASIWKHIPKKKKKEADLSIKNGICEIVDFLGVKGVDIKKIYNLKMTNNGLLPEIITIGKVA